jgi:Protein of unknown function (DUF3237)
MRDFVVPKTDTKVLGKVELEYAFQLRARFDAPHVSKTPKGDFRYQDITSGDVRGERLTATVYADSGGQYDTVRPDRVRDVDAHFILKAENGEWIYVEHVGYRRQDGYYRAIAYIDADTKGAHDWLNNTTFVVTAKESADEREVVFYYYLAN